MNLPLKNISLLLSILIIFIAHKMNCSSFYHNFDTIFLQNFLRYKNVRITINCCWDNSKIIKFLKETVQSENSKQIAIHRNLSLQTMDDFYNYIRTDNWFVMDIGNCKHYDDLLKNINKKKLFRYPLKYLFLVDRKEYRNIIELIEPFSILPMSEVVIACFEDSSVSLYQPYKIGENESLIIENYRNWSIREGINSYDIPFASRRRNFKKFPLLVSTVVNNIASTQKEDFDDIAESNVDEPYFFQDFPNIYTLIQYLNASFKFRIFDTYGYLNYTTGKFDGLVEDLYEERGHIGGTTLFLSEERHRVVEFIKSFGFWSTKARFILKKPSMSYIENIYYMTFTDKVWIATLVVLLTLAVVLYILLNWEAVHLSNQQKHKKFTISDITLISLEAVCQQGTVVDSATYSGRAIIFILFTAFLFIYTAYSAHILVLLQSTAAITSIRQLVDSRVECGGLNISFMMAYYEAAKDDALRDLYRKKIYPNRFYSLEDGLKKVQDGNFAFQVIVGPAYNYILRKYTNYDICKLQELPGYMNTEMYVAVPKTSQYKKLFKVGLLVSEEGGLQHRVKNRLSMKPKCYNEAGNFQSVRIYDCHSVFVLYAIGILLSLVVLLIEKIVQNYTRKKSYNNWKVWCNKESH